MTLASRLLEGYNPGGYTPIEEGLTPDEIMVRTNSICTEVVTGVYEAVESYYMDDIVAQTQVLTEGTSVVGKIKELINKFIERIKKIWNWFVEKVKIFPRWIRGLFKKQSDAVDDLLDKVSDQMIEKIDNDPKGVNQYLNNQTSRETPQDSLKVRRDPSSERIVCPPMVNFIGIIQKAKSRNDLIYNRVSSFVKGRSFSDVNKYVHTIVSDPSKAIYREVGRAGEFSENGLNYYAEVASRDFMNVVLKAAQVESPGEVSVYYNNMVNEINNCTETEETFVSVFKKYLESIKRDLNDIQRVSVKQFEDMSKEIEYNLKILNSDGFKTSLEKAFISNSSGNRGDVNRFTAPDKASFYISSLSKVLNTESQMVNMLMSSVQGCCKVINAVYFKCSQAFIKRKSADD